MGETDFTHRVLTAFADPAVQGALRWQVTPTGQLEFYVDCSGMFADEVSNDVVSIHPGNVAALEAAFGDVIDAVGEVTYGPELFCVRQRLIRPENHEYPADSRLWPLFDAAVGSTSSQRSS